MIEDGWIDEVRRLAVDVPAEAPAWNATGYRTIRAVAEGRITETDAQTRVVIETRQYAKRQRTWFRHQLHGEDVTFLDVTQPDGEARLFEWWNGSAA
jgi:tRNA dimethylallyltransferase